jgi:hypothetical protein
LNQLHNFNMLKQLLLAHRLSCSFMPHLVNTE